MRKVLVFGTFDILHPGHEYFLKQAKKHGDELIVVIARDLTVKQVKKEFPVNNEQERLGAVKKLDYVNNAILGSLSKDKYRIIEEVRPDVICLGYDQEAFVSGLEAKLQEKGLKPEIIRLDAYKPEKYKSSYYKSNHYEYYKKAKLIKRKE
ncbi:MAG TPA: FAD synthase [Candidatus Woesearchaeota archaeon]|nr:FAD synthase [Candidatus Woesearchaeota archaeon]